MRAYRRKAEGEKRSEKEWKLCLTCSYWARRSPSKHPSGSLVKFKKLTKFYRVIGYLVKASEETEFWVKVDVGKCKR